MLSGLFRELLGPGPADHGPPPVVDFGRMVLGAIVIACIILWVHLLPQPARAETIGYRVEAQACAGTACRPLPPSPRTWAGLYACQTRAANLERFGLPGDARTIRARCAPVAGLPRA